MYGFGASDRVGRIHGMAFGVGEEGIYGGVVFRDATRPRVN